RPQCDRIDTVGLQLDVAAIEAPVARTWPDLECCRTSRQLAEQAERRLAVAAGQSCRAPLCTLDFDQCPLDRLFVLTLDLDRGGETWPQRNCRRDRAAPRCPRRRRGRLQGPVALDQERCGIWHYRPAQRRCDFCGGVYDGDRRQLGGA